MTSSLRYSITPQPIENGATSIPFCLALALFHENGDNWIGQHMRKFSSNVGIEYSNNLKEAIVGTKDGIG